MLHFSRCEKENLVILMMRVRQNSLSASDKENYWKEDTKILNLFFVLFIISMDISVILLFNENNLWIFSLVAGLIISSVIAIILSINLKKKYK